LVVRSEKAEQHGSRNKAASNSEDAKPIALNHQLRFSLAINLTKIEVHGPAGQCPARASKQGYNSGALLIIPFFHVMRLLNERRSLC
jgi:hypothetical protein